MVVHQSKRQGIKTAIFYQGVGNRRHIITMDKEDLVGNKQEKIYFTILF